MSTSREDDALPYLEHLLAFARQGWTSLAFVPTEVLLRRYLGRRWEVSRWGGVPEAGAPQGRSTAGQEQGRSRAGAGQELRPWVEALRRCQRRWWAQAHSSGAEATRSNVLVEVGFRR